MNDITFTNIDGIPYFIDSITCLVYDSPFYLFSDFINHMSTKKKLRLYPYGKKMSRELYYKYFYNEDWKEIDIYDLYNCISFIINKFKFNIITNRCKGDWWKWIDMNTSY